MSKAELKKRPKDDPGKVEPAWLPYRHAPLPQWIAGWLRIAGASHVCHLVQQPGTIVDCWN